MRGVNENEPPPPQVFFRLIYVSLQLGTYLGGPCEYSCSDKLIHVICDEKKKTCECEDKYPVEIGIMRGCEKPKQLGDQCFYAQTCSFFDPNAICTQIHHNAICQCKPGFHTVALRKGVRKVFCTEDVVVVSADLPTLLGVATGIAVLTGLLCFVLRLFSGNRYPPTRHYANANLAPPLLFSSDNQWINGIPLTVQNRPSSRSSSCQRSTMSLAQYPRNKGVLVPPSRAGAARAAAILLIPCQLQASSRQNDLEVVHNNNNNNNDEDVEDVEENDLCFFGFFLGFSGSRKQSLTSVHSTTSSQRSYSYSARRFEQENQQKEQRAAMRAAREEAAKMAALPTPSSLSTEDLLLIPSKISITIGTDRIY
ncbi:conserved hypothetical protein [Pediculus humanus corporis]|uniref:EB domain-containing protein n=1 Tax=Pediculus humanus subsp. corporis TaxID=121224 RepID=E0VYZ1_PEDHC|nr:uncharacterized protein Phum_PHUM522130 [Pediculus humanus corporis]EEB18597.1 conserved hypothetical protein [Pediculus humanus corporis]